MHESTDYDDLGVAERCEALAEARRMAAEDECDHPDWRVVCWQRGDPRRDAYLAERNRIRVANGKRRLG